MPYIKSIPEALPADKLTPELAIEEQIRTGKQQIQNKYALQWREANRNARFLGPVKHKQLLREIDTKARQEMLAFDQQVQRQFMQLNRIDRLAEQGFIINPEEMKARMVFGRDIAESMFPRVPSVEKVYGQLETHRRRIESRLTQFRTTKERIPSIFLRKKKEALKPGELQVWDASIPVEDEEGNILMGDWRKATEEEVMERKLNIRELQRIKDLQNEILGRQHIRKRIIQPGTTGGTFSDKIAESIRQRPKPSIRDPLGLFSR